MHGPLVYTSLQLTRSPFTTHSPCPFTHPLNTAWLAALLGKANAQLRAFSFPPHPQTGPVEGTAPEFAGVLRNEPAGPRRADLSTRRTASRRQGQLSKQTSTSFLLQSIRPNGHPRHILNWACTLMQSIQGTRGG